MYSCNIAVAVLEGSVSDESFGKKHLHLMSYVSTLIPAATSTTSKIIRCGLKTQTVNVIIVVSIGML